MALYMFSTNVYCWRAFYHMSKLLSIFKVKQIFEFTCINDYYAHFTDFSHDAEEHLGVKFNVIPDQHLENLPFKKLVC